MNEWVPSLPSPPASPLDPLPPANSWANAEACVIGPDQPSFTYGVIITGVPAMVTTAPAAWGITLNDGGSPANFTIDHYDNTGALIDHPLEFSGLNGAATFNDPVFMQAASAYSLTITNGPLTIPNVGQLMIPGGPIGAYLGVASPSGALTWFNLPAPVIPSDAPTDGQLYGRQSNPTGSTPQWAPISVGTGFLPLEGGTMTGGIYFNSTTPGTAVRFLAGTASGALRWALLLGDNSAESGSNTGSNFTVQSYADNGNPLGFPFSINRQSGQTILTNLGGNTPALAIAKPNGGVASLAGANGSNLRWQLYLGDYNAELGGNLGSNFRLTRYSDAGAAIADSMFGNRQTGQITFGVMPSIPGGTSGQFLSTDGSGNNSWATITVPPPVIPTDAPTDGQQYARASVPAGTAPQWVPFVSGPPTTISDVAPANPSVGQLWWDSVGGQLYVFYNDGSSSQWVAATNVGSALPPATTTTLGGVKPDGTSIKAAVDGTISTVLTPMGDNRVDNGDMWVDQHNAGAAHPVPANSWLYCPDRFYGQNTQATSRFRMGQNLAAITTKAPGFAYFLGVQSSSAYTSAAASQLYVGHVIEADAFADMGFGAVGAQSVTISFWAISSLTGAFSFCLMSNNPIASGGTTYRYYVTTYNLPTANVWTKIVITVPGDTLSSLAWPAGNGYGPQLLWDLGSGANVQTSTLNAWQTSAPSAYAAAGAVHVTGTLNATWGLTGVKLEAGSIATPFNHQPLPVCLARCQRYFTLGQVTFAGYCGAVINAYVSELLPVSMRAQPSITMLVNNNSNWTLGSFAGLAAMNRGFTTVGSTGAAGGYVINFTYSASAEF